MDRTQTMKSAFIAKARKLVSLGDQFIKKSGNKDFHLKASDLLDDARMHELYDYKELVASAMARDFTHAQNFKDLDFSDLPLTLARGKECFVDIYFWRRRPTTIHNHHFIGAFQCLSGFNVDSEFSFKTTEKLTRFHSLGELKLKRTKTLKSGDFEPINFQDKFIHQNLHQADLSVNLCFRTPDFPKKNLSNFLFSGFKYEHDEAALARAGRLLAFTRMDDFDPKKLEISLIDAFTFLLLSYASASVHPRMVMLEKFLETKVKKETGVDLAQLLRVHDRELDHIEAQYE